MHVIRPVKITDAMLISTNIAETDEAEYNAGTTYALGAVVMVTTAGDHHRYESLQAANVGHDPKTSPTWWLDLGSTNRWKAFDNKSNSQSAAPEYVEFTIQPGKVNSLALMNIQGSKVEIEMRNGSDVVYSATEIIKKATVTGLYDYFYEPLAYKKTISFLDLPIYLYATIRIKVYGINGGTAKIGCIVCGASLFLGNIQTDASAGITDYSSVTTDDFGETTFVRRDFSKKLDCVLHVSNGTHDYVNNILVEMRSEPTAWIGVDGFDSTKMMGYFRDFSIILKTTEYSICNLSLIGIT